MNEFESYVMCDGKNYWIVVAETETSEWVYWDKITEEKAHSLKNQGMQLYVDMGMSNPDE